MNEPRNLEHTPAAGAPAELSARSREIFREVVEAYLETGDPVGSRTLAERRDLGVSPATIRAVLHDLETSGLLYAPHISAGRVPTQAGLRLFVDGLLDLGRLSNDERRAIEERFGKTKGGVEDMLADATRVLSGLSDCVGLVLAPKLDQPLKHLEFVHIGPSKALVVIVTDDGLVENRVIETPPGLTPSNLIEAGNYLAARLKGKRLDELRAEVARELERDRRQIDMLTAKVVEAGLAERGGDDAKTLIVRGQSKLLGGVHAAADLEVIARLFDDLEQKKDLIRLLELAGHAEGVKIFIGAESRLFSLSGSSLIVAPYRKGPDKVLGAIGVIGPTRLNYARIIPMVDFAARAVSQMFEKATPAAKAS